MVVFYTMPSLVSLSLDRLLASGCPPDSDLRPLPPHLKDSLRRVLLKRGRVTGPQLSSLLHPGVTEIDLGDCVITPGHLAALASECVRLRGVRDSGLQCVPRSLTHVDLGGCLQVSDSGVRRLATACPRLSSLSLSRTLITDRSLCHLSSGKCRNSLREVRVNGCVNITDSGIETLLLAGLSIQILIFHGCPGVTEQSRQALENFLRNVGHRMRQVTWTVY